MIPGFFYDNQVYLFLHLRVKLMEVRNGFYAFIEIGHIKLLIGAVQVIAIQPKT